MKQVIVLGSGLVAKPLIQYLLENPGLRITAADLFKEKAERLIAGHPRGTARALDVQDEAALDVAIAGCDLCVSLLPYTFHPAAARLCLKHKKHLVTTSYVSEAMQALGEGAAAAGLAFLNEMGLDPGIDHMSAMRIIEGIRRKGGKVTGFLSYCGGLPAPDANDNPWGYKFSWSPRGVVLAGRNDAQFLKDGVPVRIPGADLFAHHWPVAIPGYGELEGYPNRDSLSYAKLYGLEGARDMMRGTLRYPGWCFTMKKLADLQFFDLEPRNMKNLTYDALLRGLIDEPPGTPLRGAAAERLEVHEGSDTIRRLEWLGLFSREPVKGAAQGPLSSLDALANRMQEKMAYKDGERDMVVMHHEVTAEYEDGRRERTLSTLLQYGIPGGDSAMARTVGLPAAIGARMILEGRIREQGVLIPTSAAIFEPVLRELEEGAGIRFREKTVPID